MSHDGATTQPARRPRRENQLAALARIPVVRRMWAAITLSSLGDWLGLLATTALAQQLTSERSLSTQGAAISGVLLVRLAPDLLFGPIAAALADKLDRRKTVVIGDLCAGLLYASIALGYELVWLYIAQFVIEAIGLFTQPCKQVIQVSIVPKRLLATANQISLFSVYGTVPVAAGLFALLTSANRLVGSDETMRSGDTNVAIVTALLIDTVTFLVSSATVFASRRAIPVVPADRERSQSIVALLREGIAFVRHNQLIRGLYVGIIGAFAGGGLVVGVAQLWVATLSAGAAGYSIMFGTVFAGLAVGMLVGPRVLPSLSRSRVFGLAIGTAGLAMLVMSLIRNIVLAVAFAACVGLFAGMAWIIGYTLIGYEVEDRLRGRIFSFVLSSVRITLLATIAIGPVLAGALGEHRIRIGRSYLRFSGPGLTLLIAGLLAILVSLYATSKAGGRRRLRDIARRRLLSTSTATRGHHGVFVTVDGVDDRATARYADLVAAVLREQGLAVTGTAEPTQSATGRRVAELLGSGAHLEPETAALLLAADRAEHVATVVGPALDRGEAVVCDRWLLTSLAVHGGGRGADADRIRSVTAWSTGDLVPDLTVVVEPALAGVSALAGGADLDAHGVRQAFEDEVEAHPARVVRCTDPWPEELPADVVDRLHRLLRARASLLVPVGTGPAGQATEETVADPLADPFARP